MNSPQYEYKYKNETNTNTDSYEYKNLTKVEKLIYLAYKQVKLFFKKYLNVDIEDGMPCSRHVLYFENVEVCIWADEYSSVGDIAIVGFNSITKKEKVKFVNYNDPDCINKINVAVNVIIDKLKQ